VAGETGAKKENYTASSVSDRAGIKGANRTVNALRSVAGVVLGQ
jgi:hypothetical protein